MPFCLLADDSETQFWVWLPSLGRDVAIAGNHRKPTPSARAVARRVEINQRVRFLSRLSFPHRLHGALVGPARYAALLRANSSDRRAASALAIRAADPANCGCSDSTNAWLECWFRPFAGGHCPAMPQCDERQHQSPRSSSHQDPGALAKVGGRFWAAAAAYATFASPSPALRQAVDAEAVRIGLADAPRPWLGIHIRHGDSCRDGPVTGRLCTPAEEYATHVAHMVRAYGYKSLVLATDSDAALAALRAALAHLGLADIGLFVRTDRRVDPTIFKRVQRLEHAYNKGPLGWRRDPPLVEPWTEYYGFAVDLLLLSACDGFVGKFTSNLARIAYALMAARHECLLPYVSLDAFFCFGGGGLSLDSQRARTVRRGRPMGTFDCGASRTPPASTQERRGRSAQQERQEVLSSERPGLLMRKKRLAAPTPLPTAHKQAPCVDVPPDSRFTCAQQQHWGKCGEPWMRGFCCKSCHGCRDECTA